MVDWLAVVAARNRANFAGSMPDEESETTVVAEKLS